MFLSLSLKSTTYLYLILNCQSCHINIYFSRKTAFFIPKARIFNIRIKKYLIIFQYPTPDDQPRLSNISIFS
jgi:hypothetical protein